MEAQTGESGEDYLNSMNFRSLIEWITAESLLSRPEDPVLHIRSILDKKIGQRATGDKFDPEQITSYVQACYAEASASADENGRIMTREGGPVAAASTDSTTMKRLDLLEKLIAASRVIATELDPYEATKVIITQTCRILEADRSTLFLLNPRANELVLSVAEGAEDIRVPVGKGIAGIVAQTGKAVNISDCYSDHRFDSHYDMQSGYKTRNILCVPIRNVDGDIIGVMQAINRERGVFTDVDEEVLGILAAQAGIALQNANIHRLAIRSREKVKSLLDIIRALHSDLGITSMMFTITQRVQQLVDSDRCTLFLLDKAKNELWAMQGEVNIRIPATQGIAGAVAQSGETINIENAYDDERFSQEVDKKSGYKTDTILAMALKNAKGDIVGVLQLINKTNGPFDKEDEEILEAFLSIAGPVIESSQLFARSTEESSGNEFTGKTISKKVPQHSQEKDMVLIEEDEDGEEEDEESGGN